MYKRILDLNLQMKKKSHFLWGPRATGKTSLIKAQLQKHAQIVDLLDSQIYLRLSSDPTELRNLIALETRPRESIVVIDEIQRVPELLNEVHRLIEEQHLRFLLTGSSARKLKRGAANLLAGRAWSMELFPLVYSEIPDFSLSRFVRFGGLPSVYTSNEPHEELKAYVNTYLKEEIQAEGLIRRIPAFHRFLESAALSNGQLINYANIASDAQVPASTVADHYQILVDTLIGSFLEPFTKTKKRKAVTTQKFYFFDQGVVNTLCAVNSIERNSDQFGRALEQLIYMNLKAYLSYTRSDSVLGFWRSQNQQEVDFTVGDFAAIEVKASKRLASRDYSGLKALKEEKIFKKYYLASMDSVYAHHDGIECLQIELFLKKLWSGELGF